MTLREDTGTPAAAEPAEVCTPHVFAVTPGTFWTTKEENLLRSSYAQGGAQAAHALLPWRTLRSITSHAYTLGLTSSAVIRTGVNQQRWHHTPELDAMIVAEYPRCTQRGSLDALAHRLGRPAWWLRRRAAALGVAAPKLREPAWCAAEDRVLHDAPHVGLSALQKRLQAIGHARSETAIAVRLKRLRLSRIDPDVYSCKGLADLMGVSAKVVTGWIVRDGLPATRRPGSDQTTWRLHRRDVRTWICSHVALVDIRRADKWWLVDLLSSRPGRD